MHVAPLNTTALVFSPAPPPAFHPATCFRSHCATLPNWVLQALVQLLCRTAKLAWFDSDSAKALVEEAKWVVWEGRGGGC